MPKLPLSAPITTRTTQQTPMADPRTPDPVLLIVAAFSRHTDALARARDELEKLFGPIALAAEPFSFCETDYYAPTMGPGLLKQFLAFGQLVQPDSLADFKLRTNELERRIAEAGTFPENRPLNVDPGLLTLGKLVLATTKDQSHRIYLREGIFAEVTLRYRSGAFEPWPWTYADYRRPEVHTFLEAARTYFRDRLRQYRDEKLP
jgi:Domain of unknown function (DUF4416)